MNGDDIDFSNTVLDPDHPLLEPFQRALKEHLLNQISRLKEELFQIEDDAKRKEAEIVDVGARAYEAQQQVCGQQKILENLMNEIDTVAAAQEKEEMDFENNTKEAKLLQEELFEKEKTNREMLSEIESITSLNQQLSESETRLESHININKRIAEKSRQDNHRLAEQKKKQDFLLHQLLTEVWKLENEMETCNLQISVKEEEMEELEQKIAVGNTNISALEAELRGLMFSWNSVVVAVANRDKGLECLTDELTKMEEKEKNSISAIEQIKKLIRKEQLENEKFTALKDRIHSDIRICKSQLEEQMNEKAILDGQYYDVQAHMEQMERDIKLCQSECHRKQLAYNSLSEDYTKLLTKKQSIEQEIFFCIESEISNDVYGKKARKTLKEISAKRRDVEVILSEVENKKSLLYSEIESEKFKIEELNRINQDTKDQIAELELLHTKLKSENEKFEFLYRKREKQVLTLNEKLETKLGTADQDKVAKAEIKINDLTKLIDECQQEIKSLQVFWMREQKNIIAVSNDRQQQIHNISLLKKQVLILEQKNVRINDEIEELKKREEKTQHSINVLTNKTTILCDNVFKKKSKKTSLGRNNALLQGEYESKLKDAELNLLEIEAEIADVEEDKLLLSKELIEINREGLEWEKKFQMAKEAVTNLRGSRKTGEVANMRVEVHKMEVIYAQLRKAQEKLLRDMEHCISRRDTMFYKSEAKQQMTKFKKAGDRTRIHFHKKLDNVKNQIKQTKNEIESLKKKITERSNEIDEVNKQLEKTYKAPVFDKDYKYNLKKNLDELRINRQFKFELLVFQQRKANMYSLIIKNQTPFTIYKREGDLINEYHKEKDINNKLIKIIEDLKYEFPDKDRDLSQLRNSLGIVTLFMYT